MSNKTSEYKLVNIYTEEVVKKSVRLTESECSTMNCAYGANSSPLRYIKK